MNTSDYIFDENMAVLHKRAPLLADRVRGYGGRPSWETVPARSGQITARTVSGEGLVRHIHSRYDPEKEALRWAALAPRNAETLAVLGFGLGYHAVALRRRHSDGPLVIIEGDPGLFHLALRSVPLASLLVDPRTHLLVQESREDIEGFLNGLNPRSFGYLSYFPVTDLCPEYYQPIRDMLEKRIFERRLREDPALGRGIEELLRETIG
jgi:hypothetical protein